MRAPAQDPAHRIGVLTFNFGGPGEPTLAPLAHIYPVLPFATNIDLTQQFDFVFMDWRGVATTTPALSCLDLETRGELSIQTFDPPSSAEWTQYFDLVAAVGSGCSANPSNAPLLAHQDTESAARDLDALRAALGEAQMNYWGVSYGTRLGEMYAELFPHRVRAVALDSPVEPDPQFQEFLQSQSVSFDHQFQRFFAWCAGATSTECPFRTDDGLATSVAAAYAQLLATASTSPVVADGVTLDAPTIDLVATNLMYFPVDDWPMLGAALASLSAGNGSFVASLFTMGQFDYANDDNAFSSYQNVIAQDLPLPSSIATPATYQQWVATQAALAPHVGVQNATAQAFAVDWPVTVPIQHAIGATTAPPLLITATRNDPATPYAGAGALQTALANGSYLVTYEGDGHANAQFEPCLGDAVAQFLIDPTTPPSTTDCPEVPITGSDIARFHIGRRWHHAR